MIIPYQEIQPETLTKLIQDFVLREGTDYGLEDVELTQKIAEVKQQLVTGQAVIVYSELYETVNIMPSTDVEQYLHESE